MFRFNNPDALLVCLLVASAYGLVRAVEDGSRRWMIAVGDVARLRLPDEDDAGVPRRARASRSSTSSLRPTTMRRRITDLLAGGAAMIVSAGWWVAIVALWPASSRPMIDGSSDNSILNLIFGYNGLGRLTGSGGGPGGGGGGGGGGNFSGSDRRAAPVQRPDGRPGVVAAAGGAARTRRPDWPGGWRAPRTDRTRAALLLWGGWLVVSGLVFSLSGGVIHTYYTVALAPAIAALVAIGAAVAVAPARACSPPGRCSRSAWSRPPCGRSFCSVARRRGSRGSRR